MKPRFIIVGAGISGLAVGWYLKKRFDEPVLTILEASHRVGGWIRTRHEEGFLFEEGPRSCRSKGAGLNTLQLIEELKICDEVISASPEAKKRYLYFNGKMEPLPDSLISFFTSPLMKGVIPALLKEWQVARGAMDDESIGDFIERRLNKSIAERLADPLVAGIYAGDIQKLSMRSCFPEIYRKEQEHGSLVKAMLFGKKQNQPFSNSLFLKKHRCNAIFSFKNGMETLVKALHKNLLEEVKLSCSVKTIHYRKGEIVLTLQDGRKLCGDHVFLAVPAKVAAEILKDADPGLGKMISTETYATVAVVNMGWNKKVLSDEGFGYLVPSSEKQNILGVVFDSSAFAEQNHANQTRLTAMIGGIHRPEMENASENTLKEIAKEAIALHLGIYAKPDAILVSLARQAIPQYEVGHHAKLLNIEKKLQHTFSSCISLVGSAWRGVAVNDCIADAKKIVESLTLKSDKY